MPFSKVHPEFCPSIHNVNRCWRCGKLYQEHRKGRNGNGTESGARYCPTQNQPVPKEPRQ